MKTVAQLLQDAYSQGIDRVDAQILLLHACGQSRFHRAWLLAHDADIPHPTQISNWHGFIQRRLRGEPVAYITGQKAFYGLDLTVDRRVLDPRADTETLVDWALELLDADAPLHIVDLGTGSGAIALALASQRTQWHISATDASCDALDVARHNAWQLQLPVVFIYSHAIDQHSTRNSKYMDCSQNILFSDYFMHKQAARVDKNMQHTAVMQNISRKNTYLYQKVTRSYPTLNIDNWFACLKGRQFHAIISNPPYIALGDYHLHALTHEPQSALSSGVDGLDDIRQIIAGAPTHLHAGGWLILEHGHDQAQVVQCLLRTAGFQSIQGRQDLAGITRCSAGQWMGKYPDIAPTDMQNDLI